MSAFDLPDEMLAAYAARAAKTGRHALKVVTKPSDEPHWYALRVFPQKEYVVAYMLRQQGVRTFVATEEKFRRRTRYTKSKAGFAHPEIPGCVFAGFDGEPAWYHLLRNQLIIGPEGMDGRPWRLDVAKLHQFFARTLDGCMVFDEHLRMVSVPGRGLLRSPTTQVKVVSRRKRSEEDEIVVEPMGRRARLLSQYKLTIPEPVRQAA